MGLLFVLFMLALTNIWLRKPPLVKAYIIVTLVFYTALNFVNVDKIIARSNINLYSNTGKLDIYYLQTLSYDAVPEIIQAAENSKPELSRQLNESLSTKKLPLSNNWQSFNHSRYRANALLAK